MIENGYMIATDYSFPVIYKKKGGICETWSARKSFWRRDDDAVAAFIGFWPAQSITEEEALSIIERFSE